MNRKILAVGILLVLAAAGAALFFSLRACSAGETEDGSLSRIRQNTLALVQSYLDREEYGRALELLEDLLIDNPDDG
ncbi:MAG: hypothetical protein IAA96_01555, partial [Spirochaetes bacterium]|nr:hypothetical protein [Candidatus Avitreponema avistercoris]